MRLEHNSNTMGFNDLGFTKQHTKTKIFSLLNIEKTKFKRSHHRLDEKDTFSYTNWALCSINTQLISACLLNTSS